MRERWFLWPLLLHLSAWLLLGHVYEIAVFQDAARHLAIGQGVYENFSGWFSTHGEGYYASPPLYAYMLWASGAIAKAFGGHWWLSQLAIKAWMLIADLLTVTLLYRVSPSAARSYWTLWFVPVVAIGLVQPDLWVGLSVLLAFLLAQRGRWLGTGLALAAGIGMKMAPIILLPFLALHLIQTRRWRPLLKVAAGVASGLALVWLPYVIAFDDAGKFGEVLLFHITRPAAGLNVLAGLQQLADAGLTVALLVGHHVPTAPVSGVTQRVAAVYPVLTLLVFIALAILAWGQRWSLRQVFCVPLLAFLLSNKVVFEQYALHALPLLLLTFPSAWPKLAAPYIVYLVAAGTPWRFFPAEYGLPSTPDALLPISWHAVTGAWLMLGFTIVTAMAVLLFNYRLYTLVRGLLHATASSDTSHLQQTHPSGPLNSLRMKPVRALARPELERP